MLNQRFIYLFCFVAGLTLASIASHATADANASKASDKTFSHLKGYDANGGQGKSIYEVPIEGTIDLGLAAFVERVSERASADSVLIFRITTFGGRVDAAVRIKDAILGTAATTIAYIEGRAISAGALIALSCDTLLMSPGASMGAATPVQGGGATGETKPTSEKVVSYMRAEMRATAEATGRRADLAEAMVDADIEIKDIIATGKLLTLTSQKAVELKLADAVIESYTHAKKALNLERAALVKAETHWAEKLARFLTDPTISSLLMSFGFIGLLMELYTPGFGVGGIIGVSCLFLFFLGQYAASLAGFEELLLFGSGLFLVLLEIFVIPGFGIAGLLGGILLVVGFAMGMVELGVPLDVALDLGYAQEAFEVISFRLAIVLVVLIIAAFFLFRRLPTMKAAQWMILKQATSDEEGFVSTPDDFKEFLGKRGIAKSDLRPSGIADFDGRRMDVQTAGDFVKAGACIEVVELDGTRLLVKEI